MVADGASRRCEPRASRDDQIEVQRSADLRFQGQAYELTLPMPDRPLDRGRRADAVRRRSCALYERTYGEGTAWKGVPASLINYSVTVIGRQDASRPRLGRRRATATTPADIARDARAVFLPGRARAGPRSRSTTTPASPPGTDDRGPGDHRRGRHDDLRAAGHDGRARRVPELRPDPLEETIRMSTPDYDVIAAEVHRKALQEPHRRDGDHPGPHLRARRSSPSPRTSRPA